MLQQPEDDTSSLERARASLYRPGAISRSSRAPLTTPNQRTIPHKWEENSLKKTLYFGKRRMHLASTFFAVTVLFFIIALGVAGYVFYYGGNTVSVDKVTIAVQGPTTIAGGDTVPLSLTITNKNGTAIDNATIEIDFPDGTRNATDVLSAYPRYVENLGTIDSGATVTRSVKVRLFGNSGNELSLPISLSYKTTSSNSVFVKKSSYALAISSAPLSVSVETPTEVISGKPITLKLTVRSNATIPLDNVVIAAAFPFGFSFSQSSLPLNNSSFLLGTVSPNTSRTITITGTLLGQDKEQRNFHFTVGTAKTAQDQTLAITYMSQDATVAIAAPFITTTLSINGNTSTSPVINSGNLQSATVSYTNTLLTKVQNATITITVSGSSIDYNSIKASNGFYSSADHSIIFSRDTDPSLATLAPGASGIGTFTFSTLAPDAIPSSPTITFSVSASGIPIGQTNSTEITNTSVTKTVKVITTVALSQIALHSSGPISNSGPIPPVANHATTYTIIWSVQNKGSAVAGGTVSAILPNYVSYTGATAGSGSFTYDKGYRTVSWSAGNLAQGASASGAFQISLTPSTSQKGTPPTLIGGVSFSGYDRFAGVQVSASASPVTTETIEDPGYISTNSIVQ